MMWRSPAMPRRRRQKKRTSFWSPRWPSRPTASSTLHMVWQPKDDVRKRHENRDSDQMRDEMREGAVEHFTHRTVGIARHDEAIQSDRRRDHADLGGDDLDDAEPDRIEAERLDQR